MDRSDPWARLIAAAGAVGAAVALVYMVGGASLSLRYEGFGLPGQQAAAQTPREVLLAAGLRTLTIWVLLGVGLVLSLRALPDATERALVERLRRPLGLLAVAVVALLLLVLLEVWWPLATYGALLAIVLASVRWKARPLPRVLASVFAVALVAVAYEADRLTYQVERTCVTVARTAGESGDRGVCGTLIGQQDRGFYVGVPLEAPGGGVQAARPQRLLFVPAARVSDATSRKQLARVTEDSADSRRRRLLSRLWDVRVR